jgi:ADP-ribose pyrophosphatase YjhB (NUDIX family)
MYRKGISALIINDKQEFLLLNLESFEEKYFAISGGGLEENETLEESCYREIKEEAGEVRSYKWVKYADLKDYLLFENQLEDTQEKIRELFVNVTF